ncbi:MAG: glycoside hydrolase family 13 protein [Chloroflexota bacterium]
MTSEAPSWARDAIFYQVFPDRFASSSRVPDPGVMEPWAALPTLHGFKGGDLLGLAGRLDELVDLGITALYLNPIFTAASNHRYNTYDFMAVDPLLGGDAALRELLDRAHERGIRVILDGVFNHAGRGFWPFQHVIESGGASPYRDWFYLDGDVLDGSRSVLVDEHLCGEPGTRGYRSWWDVPGLPKLRVEHPPVREYLMQVVEHWTRFGIDGWRLDVPQDIEDPTFWPEFRSRVRAINPEAYLVGEIWVDAPEWLTGERFDALMNYPLTMAILGFVGGPHLDLGLAAGQQNYRDNLVALDGPGFAAKLVRNLTMNRPEATAVQFNLLGSHDAPRAMSVLSEDAVRLRIATLLQLSLPGTPSIYYGDELAMSGGPDPDCRRSFPERLADAGDAALDHRAYVRSAIAARRDAVALRRGNASVVAAAGRAIALARNADGHHGLVLVNAGDETQTLELGRDRLAGLDEREELTIGRFVIGEDQETVMLDPRSAAVLLGD